MADAPEEDGEQRKKKHRHHHHHHHHHGKKHKHKHQRSSVDEFKDTAKELDDDAAALALTRQLLYGGRPKEGESDIVLEKKIRQRSFTMEGHDRATSCVSLLFQNKPVPIDMLEQMCADAHTHYSKFPNVIDVRAPICIVGDLHGQDEDLLTIFRLHGRPSYEKSAEIRYLFLGDLINRGNNGIRVVLLVLGLSVCFKSSVFSVRGNHESEDVACVYGFRLECLKKYGEVDGVKAFEAIMKAVSALPLAAVVNKRLYCCHGGIGPKARKVHQIDRLDRHVMCVDVEGPMADILWSDPSWSQQGYVFNSKRNAGCRWGLDKTKRFLKRHNFERIIRGHEMCKEGYKFDHENLVVTVFSASNYYYRHDNRGAILVIDKKGEVQLVQYRANYQLPEDKDLHVEEVMPHLLGPEGEGVPISIPAAAARSSAAASASGSSMIRVQSIKNIKLKMRIKTSRKKYLQRLHGFFQDGSDRRAVIEGLKPTPPGTPSAEEEKDKDTDFDVIDEAEEEVAFNELKRSLRGSMRRILPGQKVVAGIGPAPEVARLKSEEDVKKEKAFARAYLEDFQSSIAAKLHSSRATSRARAAKLAEDSAKDEKIRSLGKEVDSLTKRLCLEQEQNTLLAERIESLTRRLEEAAKAQSELEAKLRQKDEDIVFGKVTEAVAAAVALSKKPPAVKVKIGKRRVPAATVPRRKPKKKGGKKVSSKTGKKKGKKFYFSQKKKFSLGQWLGKKLGSSQESPGDDDALGDMMKMAGLTAKDLQEDEGESGEESD